MIEEVEARIAELVPQFESFYRRTGDMTALRTNGDRLDLREFHRRMNLRLPENAGDLRASAKFMASWMVGLNNDVEPTQRMIVGANAQGERRTE